MGRCAAVTAVSGLSRNSTLRLAAIAVLPSSSATTAGSPTRSRSWSLSRWAIDESRVPSRTASSYRPSSTSPTRACNRFADSCACVRNASASARTVSSSRTTACISVRSRSVSTAPTGLPSTSAGLRLTNKTRSAATCN
jgi:hypothetical protein